MLNSVRNSIRIQQILEFKVHRLLEKLDLAQSYCLLNITYDLLQNIFNTGRFSGLNTAHIASNQVARETAVGWVVTSAHSLSRLSFGCHSQRHSTRTMELIFVICFHTYFLPYCVVGWTLPDSLTKRLINELSLSTTCRLTNKLPRIPIVILNRHSFTIAVYNPT